MFQVDVYWDPLSHKVFHEILTLLKLLLFVIYSTVHYEVTFEST